MLFLDATNSQRLDVLSQFLRENWLLLVPLVLGFFAIYWLLPQPGRTWKLPGIAAGSLALVLTGALLVRWEFLLIEGVLFYAFAGLAVLAGALMVTQSSPVHAALSFALVVLSTCGLFLLLAAPFLMAATIIIYAGAIVVTFLFVIMLAQQKGASSADQRSREPFLACLAGLVLVGALIGVLRRNYESRDLDLVLEQVDKVAKAKTLEEARNILGNPGNLPEGPKTLELVDRLQKYFQHEQLKPLAQEDALTQRKKDGSIVDTREKEVQEREIAHSYQDLLIVLEDAAQGQRLEALSNAAAKIHELGLRLRPYAGSLMPPPHLPLYSNSGAPASAPLAAKDGRVKERLPAGNVAALGRSLYTDYLVPVELAGMLLLVATIGAIIIAGRRAEERR